jgi:oxygen-independent coproporphyrinogen-3 oxidase
VHIPFCRALCWLCTCRTQTGGGTGGGTGGRTGGRTGGGTARYLDRPGRAIARAGACLPEGIAITRMPWGGGSPSVLTAAEIAVLLRRLARAFDIARGAQFTMEIARRDVTDALLETLAAGAGGLTRASIPAIDHDAPVRRAINRAEDCDAARRAAAGLRARSVDCHRRALRPA